jgi:hypothetical protein
LGGVWECSGQFQVLLASFGDLVYDPPPSGIRGHQLRMLQASPDLAYGARVQSTLRLEENRRNN